MSCTDEQNKRASAAVEAQMDASGRFEDAQAVAERQTKVEADTKMVLVVLCGGSAAWADSFETDGKVLLWTSTDRVEQVGFWEVAKLRRDAPGLALSLGVLPDEDLPG